jgi:glycosyltransferase involved in cell wall biosynthesis
VAIPVYNQRSFIERAICSAIAQDIDRLEILVSDNFSDDGTWEALQKFERQGVRLHRNAANLGLFANFNRCLELSKGRYGRLLSGDDALPSGCLREEVAIMQRNPHVAMLSTRGRFVAPDGRYISLVADDFPAGVYGGNAFPVQWMDYYFRYRRNPLNYPSGILFRRSAIDDLRFSTEWKTTGDIDFYFNVLKRGDLGIADITGCEVTRHSQQAHVNLNLDGTAIREQIKLRNYHYPASGRDHIDKLLAGACLGIALLRVWRPGTRPSALTHWRLALQLTTNPLAWLMGLSTIVGYRTLRALKGSGSSYVPVPRPLAA